MATPQAKDEIRVLLVDDDQDDYVLTRDLLAEIAGGRFRLDWIVEYDEGLKGICSGDYDVILLDHRLGAKTGIELLAEARKNNCHAPIIIFTGLTDPDIDLAAMQFGAAHYLEKTRLDSTLLERTIRYAIQQHHVEAELERRVKERTEELDRANAALREADRRKDEFLATLAHELRNPLAPIRNALEIMRISGDKPEAIATARALMERQVGTLVRLIDDLLDVSRITRGKVRLTRDRLELAAILDAAVEQSRPLLDKGGQSLTVTLPEEPIWVSGDRVRLAQVFTNLLNNAAKYSEAGGKVTIEAARQDSRAVVCIRDTGIGIPREMLSQVFEPFTQVDRNLNRSQGGLGIGLNLVRRLVELHDGTVTVDSPGTGRGAEFTVSLPCEPQ
jgi:signal transduction histidine kinase